MAQLNIQRELQVAYLQGQLDFVDGMVESLQKLKQAGLSAEITPDDLMTMMLQQKRDCESRLAPLLKGSLIADALKNG